MEMPTKMGSDAWKNFNSGFDARVIHTLRTKEYLIAGKTSTAEFAVNHQSKTNIFLTINCMEEPLQVDQLQQFLQECAQLHLHHKQQDQQ